MSEQAERPVLAPVQHERTDVRAGRLVLGIAGAGAVAVLLGALVLWLYPPALNDQIIREARQPFPAPQLQQNTAVDMRRFLKLQMERVNGVWWVDRSRGLVHMPIDDAMQLLVREGIADWPTAPIDPAPRDDALRNGTVPNAALLREVQRNVLEQTFPSATPP